MLLQEELEEKESVRKLGRKPRDDLGDGDDWDPGN
jgi:hypothetical protein